MRVVVDQARPLAAVLITLRFVYRDSGSASPGDLRERLGCFSYPYSSLCRRQQQTVVLPSMAGRIYTVVMGSFGFGTSERITIMRLTSRLGRELKAGLRLASKSRRNRSRPVLRLGFTCLLIS